MERMWHNLKVAKAALAYENLWSWLIVTSAHFRGFFWN